MGGILEALLRFSKQIMAAQKGFVFSAEDLYALLVHYTDGECPLAGEVRQIGVNPYLERMIGMYVESDEWEEDSTPLQIRYEGKHIATWTDGDEQMEWTQRADTPPRQTT